jgi:ABC-type phosphate transport system substrate-binding protein
MKASARQRERRLPRAEVLRSVAIAMERRRLLIVTLTVSLALAGCKHKDEQDSTDDQELFLLCGSSFVKPIGQLCSEFTGKTGTEIATTVAGTGRAEGHNKHRNAKRRKSTDQIA